MEFFATVFDSLLSKEGQVTKVIDFGSLDINGGPHNLLKSNSIEYIGVDLAEGKNVTLVRPAELVDLPSGSFDIAMSSELFEHTPLWREILYNMGRLTKPGGIVVFSCAGRHRPEHGTSKSDGGFSAPFVVGQGVEHYGNVTAAEIKRAISLENWFDAFGVFENPGSYDTYFVGVRSGATPSKIQEAKILIEVLNKKYSHSFLLTQIKFFAGVFLLNLKTRYRIYIYRVRKLISLVFKQ